MSNYTINSVTGKREFESKFGPLVSYKLTISGDDGYNGEAEMTRKPESAPPEAGQTIEGTLDKSNPKFPPKLKKAQGAGGFGGASGGGSGRPSKDSDSIERQVAYKGAVELTVSFAKDAEEAKALLPVFFGESVVLIQDRKATSDTAAIVEQVKAAFDAEEVGPTVSDKQLADAYREWANVKQAEGLSQADLTALIQQKKLAIGVNDMSAASAAQRQEFYDYLTEDVS
jgi:hypothetical protein